MIVSPEALLEPVDGRFDDRAAVAAAWADSMRAFREGLKDPKVLDAGVLVGWPGSGKSTWAAAHDDERILLFDAVWSHRGRRTAIAKRIREARKNPVARWVRTSLSLALQRNADRPDWRRVPEAVVLQAARDLRATPPSREEGWYRVLEVRGG
jgi:predicted kinase